MFQILNKAGLLKSYKGKGGGFSLVEKSDKITIFDLVEIFQGPFHLSEHTFKGQMCPNMKVCYLKTKLDDIEDELITDSATDRLLEIQARKKELLFLKRNIFPVSEAIRAILKDESTLISKQTRHFLADTNDHLNQLVQLIESFRESITSLMEIQMANVSNRMNDVMKTLTIIATIFIPLTFLAGIYGMNFANNSALNMPELYWQYGYIFAIGLMVFSVLASYLYFRRKGWI